MQGGKTLEISVWVCLNNEGFKLRYKSQACLACEDFLIKGILHCSHKSLNTREWETKGGISSKCRAEVEPGQQED